MGINLNQRFTEEPTRKMESQDSRDQIAKSRSQLPSQIQVQKAINKKLKIAIVKEMELNSIMQKRN